MVRSKTAQEQTSWQQPLFNRSAPRARLGLFPVGRGGGKRSAFDDDWCVRLGERQTRFLHNEERDVAKWHEAIVQTYVDRTGDLPPNSTIGESF